MEKVIEVDDGYDLKKVSILAIIIILAAVGLSISFDFIDINSISNISEIIKGQQQIKEFPDKTTIAKPVDTIVTDKPLEELVEEIIPQPTDISVRAEYEKYIEFGLSIDDVVDIQNIDCVLFNQTALSPDPKFTEIFEQKRSECS